MEVNKWSGMKVNLKKKIVSNDISDFILIEIRFGWSVGHDVFSICRFYFDAHFIYIPVKK